MKTIEDLKTKISDAEKELEAFAPSKTSKVEPSKQLDKFTKKINARVAFIRKCILYLETSPTKEFIEKQLKDVNKGLTGIKDECKQFAKTKERVTEIKKERGFKKLSDQKKALQFILY